MPSVPIQKVEGTVNQGKDPALQIQTEYDRTENGTQIAEKTNQLFEQNASPMQGVPHVETEDSLMLPMISSHQSQELEPKGV